MDSRDKKRNQTTPDPAPTRPFLPLYSIVYFDAFWVKVREENRVINKAVYVSLL